mgnify:CR=1 FL=1
MDNLLLSPPVAFLVYLGIGFIVAELARRLAASSEASEAKRSTYAGGEALKARGGAPGYRQFFIVALFFAILHLGALVLGSGGQALTALPYLAGLFVALFALILG